MNEWTTEIPKQEGWYWFYGDVFTDDLDKYCRNELQLVHIRKISNGFAYITCGNFMSNKKGWWKDVVLPEVPIPYSPEIRY